MAEISGTQKEPSIDSDIEDSPYAEVRAVVSRHDDPATPSLTFRVWALGILFLGIMASANQYYFFRDAPIKLSVILVQVLSYPLGRLLAWALPHTRHTWRVFGWGFEWTLNPGPFSFKELVLITVFASAGSSSAYAIEVVVIKRKWFGAGFGFWPSAFLCLSSQLIGYGLAGVAQPLLVRPAAMVWRENLVALSVLNSFFPDRPADRLFGVPRWTRARFFWVACGLSAVWYIVPGFLFPGLSSLSLLCIAFPNRQLMHIIGSGRAGLGVLSLTLDWNSVSNAYLAGPVSTPFSVACNMMAGFVLFVWVALPVVYFTNLWGSASMPMYDYHLYTESGALYNMSSIITPAGEFDAEAYRQTGPIRIPAVYALSYGIGFAGLASLISYIGLHHGHQVWMAFQQSRAETLDIHAKLMTRYRAIPPWWFVVVLVASSAMGLVACQAFDIGLPWWGFLLSLAIPVVFTIPVGYIQATTNIQPGLNIITEMLIGFILPGRPVANMVFKVFGYITTTQSLSLVSDLKLGHYAKIPPRHMFIVQLTSTVIAVLLELLVTYRLLDSVPGLCSGYPWSCRSASVFYNASILYGAIGPAKMFLGSSYRVLFWGFLVGLLLPVPVHFLQRRYHRCRWLQKVHVPVVLNFLGLIPVISPLWVPAWFLVNFGINYVVRKYRPAWHHHYSYALSAALDTGILVTGLVMNFALEPVADRIVWWGSQIDQCPLARRPWIQLAQETNT
ncbi:oligopeptide transporter 7-like protein [Linderina pennispora]|uniref:Oligopeptide transporter 7-like protein n=1 Tax=Linderina pennispora TaxID=61395 RepID=A0A1Y1W508_9FUNG|nr:oligopeptide transporter 7-like protein [Linderina pennispora]ORX68643.1 oligopeptide transporter 7-like protein [Linderina pennispora]